MSVHSDDSNSSGESDARSIGGGSATSADTSAAASTGAGVQSSPSAASSALATPLQMHQAAHPPRMHMDALTLAPPPSPPAPFTYRTQGGHQAATGQQQPPSFSGSASGAAAAAAAALLSPTSAALTLPLQMDAGYAEAQAASLAASLAASRDPNSHGGSFGTGSGSAPQRTRAPLPEAPAAAYAAAPQAAQPAPAVSPFYEQHAPLESPVEMLQQLLHRSAAPSSSAHHSSVAPAPPPAQAHPSLYPASSSEAHVIALADALSSSLSHSHSRSGVLASAAKQQARGERGTLHKAQEERERDTERSVSRGAGLEQQLQRLHGQHQAEMASQERAHTFAQADLLTAFQLDRAEAERRQLAALEELREQLAQRDSDLTAHQQLYHTYSQRIQSELRALHEEVAEAQGHIAAHESHAREQVSVIARLESERDQLARQSAEREESDRAARAQWERELVQRSNDVLLLKQESWESERQELLRLQRELSDQLQSQTDARSFYETKFSSSDAARAEAEAKLRSAQETLRAGEAQARLLRDQHGACVAELAAAQERERHACAQASDLGGQLAKLQREYAQLEALCARLGDEGASRAAALQSEAARSQQDYAAELAGHERALREVARTRADRLALQHALLSAREKSRKARIFSHWVHAAQGRKMRSQALGDLVRFRLRLAKRAVWARWKAFDLGLLHERQVRAAEARATDAARAREMHFAALWHGRALARRKPEFFHEWAQLARQKLLDHGGEGEEEQEGCGSSRGRCRSPRCAGSRPGSRSASASASRGRSAAAAVAPAVSPACHSCEAAVAAVAERSKKIELFHLLESERQGWAGRAAAYEQRLRQGEAERLAQQREISALQGAFAALRSQHDLAHEFQSFAKAVLHTPVAAAHAAAGAAPSSTPHKHAGGGGGAFTFDLPQTSTTSAAAGGVGGGRAQTSPRSQRSMSPPQRDRPVIDTSLAPNNFAADTVAAGAAAAVHPSPLDAPSPYIALLSGSQPRSMLSPSPERGLGLSTAPESSPLRAVAAASAAARSASPPAAPELAGKGSSLHAFVSVPDREAGSPAQPQRAQHKLDLTALLDDIQAAQAAREARAELRALQHSVGAEHARLEVLAQLRREREQEDREQARLGPSFLAQRMPASAVLPPYPQARPLSDGHAAKLDAAAAAARSKGAPSKGRTAGKPRLTSPVRRTTATQHRAK